MPSSSSSRAQSEGLVSRLLNAKEAAQYLGFKSPEVLKNIAVQPIRLAANGLGKAERWDRRALDAYLDNLSGLGNHPTLPAGADNDAASEFEAWNRGRATRGS